MPLYFNLFDHPGLVKLTCYRFSLGNRNKSSDVDVQNVKDDSVAGLAFI